MELLNVTDFGDIIKSTNYANRRITMLRLIDIVKDYQAGDETVRALKNVNIEFRRNEFVAILGPSGCGKTTLLNLIGGLDQYTSGDLRINNKSTKKFKDHDWDSYRNHSVGFVFQSYNLIPHQSVLANVELALTLSGVGKAERRRRAKEALEKVGLGNQLHKRPNQMSGGQMQRVAIARALVNDPEILLADEPTGALDSQTSVQIMEILKEISKEKLIIMVTHNPDLAEEYASRTVKLLDGEIISDSAPYESTSESEHLAEVRQISKTKKTSMSFFTALSLSLNNLMTKKARTILTAFAGSIGIIGIALILSVSTGVQTYIDRVQEDTLSSYPLQINSTEIDMTDLLMNLTSGAEESEEGSKHELDAVYENQVMYEMMNSVNSTEAKTNNLKPFKEFLETDERMKEYASAISYSYATDMNVYVKDREGAIVKSDVMELMSGIYSAMGVEASSEMMSNYMQLSVWGEMLKGSNGELINPLMGEQYDVVAGRWPESYDEVVVVVSKNNEISDMMLYALGLKTGEEITESLKAAANHEQIEIGELASWSYEDIMNLDFRIILDCCKYQLSGNRYIDATANEAGLKYLYDSKDAIKLKVVGVVRPNEDAVASFMANTAVAYTSALTEHIVNVTNESEIVKAQLADPETDVILGLKFRKEGEELTLEEIKASTDEYISKLTPAEKALIYTELACIPDEATLAAGVQQFLTNTPAEQLDAMLLQSIVTQTGMDEETIKGYLSDMSAEDRQQYTNAIAAAMVTQQYAEGVQAQLAPLSTEQIAAMLDSLPMTDSQYTSVFEKHVPSTRSDSTYDEVLKELGHTSLDTPTAINIYASTFENKDMINELIAEYNDSAEEGNEIAYTDYVKILMSSITTIISAISYVLIAFVAISLVVSSIMIGIITYISVLERTKEIGILRAVGASKKDIARVFNAETLIVGFTAGALGIGITLALLVPINMILHHFTGIEILSAILPWQGAVLLVLISMFLTLIAGLFPSRIAAKKDPVVALRTE